MSYFSELSRFALGFSAITVLFSCGGADPEGSEQSTQANENLSEISTPADHSEASATDGEGGENSDFSSESVDSPTVFLGIMPQTSGPLQRSSWGDLIMSGDILLSVVDVGAEPRRALVLNADVGQVEMLQFEMDMTMGMSMGGEDLVMMDTPKVTFTIESELTSIAEDGSLDIRWLYKSVDVAEGVGMMAGQGELMEAEMRGLVGMGGQQTLNALGYPMVSTLSGTGGLSPRMQEQMRSVESMLESAAFVLPAVSVGVGASWETLRELENNGFSFLVHQVVQLTELTDTEASFSVSTTQVIGDSAPQVPNLPEGAEVDVTSLESSGSGQITMVEGMINSKSVRSELDLAIEMTVSGIAPDPVAMALQNQTGLIMTSELASE